MPDAWSAAGIVFVEFVDGGASFRGWGFGAAAQSPSIKRTIKTRVDT